MTSKIRLPLSRRAFAAGAAATAALAALAAAGLPVGRARAAAPLKIGAIFPLSGIFAREGQGCKRGIELAAPILADMGMPIQVMMVDTESSVDKARTLAEKLIGEGAQVLTGAFDSAQTSAIAQVAEQKGVPFVINIAAAPAITEQGYKFVFRNFPTAPMIVGGGFNLMKSLFAATGRTPKTAVFMYANDTFGQAMAKGIQAMFPKFEMPFQIVETIPYDPKARDLSVEVTKAKATKAEFLMPVTHGVDAITLVRELVKQRWEPTGVVTPGSPGMYEAQFYDSLGKYSEFLVTNITWINPKTGMSKALAAAFAKQFPKDVLELNVGFTFEAALIAADAYKRAGSADPKALAEALRKTSIAEHVMTGGPIQFDAKGQNVNIRSVAVQNLKRKPIVVLPEEFAAGAPVFPMPGWNDKKRA
jgi:branched-chain amino acid transport system substrate-binding protein